MPAFVQEECFDATPWLINQAWVSPEAIPPYHFDACDATNLLRDGFWRWFCASSRCYCDCHELVANPEYLPWLKRRATFAIGVIVVVIMLGVLA